MTQFKIATISLLVLALTSCDFFQKKGCTDYQAINYDATADRDDYSCVYDVSGIIYWDNTFHNYMTTSGVTHISIFIEDDQISNNLDISNYSTLVNSYPNGCNDTSWIPLTDFRIGGQSYQSFRLDVKNQNDSIFWTQVLDVNYGCNQYKIWY